MRPMRVGRWEGVGENSKKLRKVVPFLFSQIFEFRRRTTQDSEQENARLGCPNRGAQPNLPRGAYSSGACLPFAQTGAHG